MSYCNTETTSLLVAADCATWALADQQAWMAVFDPIRCARRCPWARQTQYQNAGVFTRYLAFVKGQSMPIDLHPDGMRAFIRESQRGGCSVITISGYCWAIWKVLRKIRPTKLTQFCWLYRTCCNLARVARTAQKKGARRSVDSAELTMAGEQLIAEARRMVGLELADLSPLVTAYLSGTWADSPSRFRWSAIQQFRDGLILIVGAYAPERRRALTTITVDQIDLERGMIEFAAHQIKTKRASSRPLPHSVIELIVEWLTVWRPHCHPRHNMLWVKKGGGIMRDDALYSAIKVATRRTLGVALTPHDFRDAAATLVVEEAPARVGLATLVLDQRSEEMTRNYTEQANQINATREMAATMARTRDATEQKVRKMTRSTIALNPRARRKRVKG